MRRGIGWSPCCRGWMGVVVRGVIIGRRSTGCCGGCGPGLRGAICLGVTGPGRLSTSGSPAGKRTGPGQSCWNTSRSATTRWAGWSGPSPSTPRSTGHASTRPRRPHKGAADGDEPEDPGRSQARQALGRSRGGLTTKVHLAVDGRGTCRRSSCSRPATSTTPPPSDRSSTASESRAPLRADLARHRRGCRATKRIPAGRCAACLRRRGIVATIPERRDQMANRRRRGPHGGRHPRSTRTSTATATWSNDVSPDSSSGGFPVPPFAGSTACGAKTSCETRTFQRRGLPVRLPGGDGVGERDVREGDVSRSEDAEAERGLRGPVGAAAIRALIPSSGNSARGG